jgi:Fe-S oxidoreductase
VVATSSALATTILVLATALGTAIAVAVLGLSMRSRYWMKGRSGSVSLGRGLLRLPRRYLVDVHAIVGRDRESSLMHALTAGGLLASILLIGVAAAWTLAAGNAPTWLAIVILVASSAAVFGGALAGLRRRRLKSHVRSLSKGWWHVLGPSLGLLGLAITVLVIDALTSTTGWQRPSVLAVLGAILALPGLVAVASAGFGGPLKHAAAGALYLAAHPRPERFEGKPSTDLRPVQDSQSLGAAHARDLPWNRLLSTDACVECGRCEAACPAFAAGMPLNPKRLIRDVLEATGAPVPRYRGSPHPNTPGGERAGSPGTLVPDFIRPETLWSCTTCRACVQACPMFIEHVDTIIDIRRYLTMDLGEVPQKGAEALMELRETDEPGGRDLARRFDWAFDLGVPVLAEGGATDVLLWVGDTAFESRAQATLRSLVRLLKRANVNLAVLGAEERDCGDLARRLGDEITFERLARKNIEALARRTFKRIVTADPHALHCLRNEYPAFGGTYDVVHHTSYLLELVGLGKLVVSPAESSVTYHDPCYLGRYNDETEPPRLLLQRIGVKVIEMKRSGKDARCCGAGGGVAITDMRAERRIADIRMDDACATQADTVAVACPNCMKMLEGTSRLPVVDIVELVEHAAMRAEA